MLKDWEEKESHLRQHCFANDLNDTQQGQNHSSFFLLPSFLAPLVMARVNLTLVQQHLPHAVLQTIPAAAWKRISFALGLAEWTGLVLPKGKQGQMVGGLSVSVTSCSDPVRLKD